MNISNIKNVACAILPLIFSACSNSVMETPTESISVEEDSEHEGFIRIASENSSVTLGTKISSAKSSERPEMRVRFTYNFSIGKSEVTCEEFNKIMDSDLASENFKYRCEGSTYPVSNVTFYDAALFANAKSKSEGLDTAYTYKDAFFDNDGHCTELGGFTFHPEANAYRLPTEAEWVLAASQGWQATNSWNADNSLYKPHKVCTSTQSTIGLCDMAGNVMEWVNDWQGNFKDTSLTNFVGAPSGGSIGERVVKGGSFRNPASALNTFSRGDIYTVTSSTRADYVGFRLAIGAIPDPVWLENNGSATSSRIITLVNSETIRKLAGTYKAKLAFRNDATGNLAYIDYASGDLSVKEIKDTIEVYHPDISPDGNLVAFCTGIEGVKGNSTLYVRNLDNSGSNLQKLEFESAAIPRWKILENGDTVITFVNSAENNKDEAAFLKNSTWQVSFSNGKFGTPQKLFNGNYHGGISENATLAVTGARLLRARISTSKSALDTIWYNGEQACNASLSKTNKQTLFLDFASETGKNFVGHNYIAHEQLFIADSTGKLINSIKAPSSYTFDHTEWATSNIASATLTNMNGAHEKIALINTADSSITEIVEGEELWHPTLWVKQGNANTNTTLDLDSAGAYFHVGGSEAALCLRVKMELLWSHLNSKLAILGSSRPLNGIIPTLMEDSLDAINLSNVPNCMFLSNYIFKNYLINHLSHLKYVVISLDIDMWWKQEKSADNFFYQEYKQYAGFAYDENHKFFESGYPEGLREATQESYSVQFFEDLYIPSRGFNPEETNSWEEIPAVEHDSTWFDSHSNDYYANFQTLESIIETAKNFNITVIGVIFPMSPNFKKTGSFGRYGIRRSQAPALIEELSHLHDRHSNFILMDENKMGDHDYTDEMANNRDHLSRTGAEVFTHRLDSLVKSINK